MYLVRPRLGINLEQAPSLSSDLAINRKSEMNSLFRKKMPLFVTLVVSALPRLSTNYLFVSMAP